MFGPGLHGEEPHWLVAVLFAVAMLGGFVGLQQDRKGTAEMVGFVIIPDSMERAMQRDLDRLRDSLPESERATFEAERHVHRQAIINHFAEHGSYPEIGGIEKVSE